MTRLANRIYQSSEKSRPLIISHLFMKTIYIDTWAHVESNIHISHHCVLKQRSNKVCLSKKNANIFFSFKAPRLLSWNVLNTHRSYRWCRVRINWQHTLCCRLQKEWCRNRELCTHAARIWWCAIHFIIKLIITKHSVRSKFRMKYHYTYRYPISNRRSSRDAIRIHSSIP